MNYADNTANTYTVSEPEMGKILSLPVKSNNKHPTDPFWFRIVKQTRQRQFSPDLCGGMSEKYRLIDTYGGPLGKQWIIGHKAGTLKKGETFRFSQKVCIDTKVIPSQISGFPSNTQTRFTISLPNPWEQYADAHQADRQITYCVRLEGINGEFHFNSTSIKTLDAIKADKLTDNLPSFIKAAIRPAATAIRPAATAIRPVATNGIDKIYASKVGSSTIKIGTSKDPEKRKKSVEGWMESIELLGTMPGGYSEEARIHDLLKGSKVPGKRELFYPTKEVMDWIGANLTKVSDVQ
jgi:hypothetical protein